MFISRQLKQFIAIAENISLTNAAEQLNLTPSALSHGIRELESKTGISLIKRSGQKVSLTTAGTHLYNDLLPYYLQMKNIEDKLSERKGNRISVNVKINGLYCSLIRGKILKFCKERHNIDLSLTSEEQIDIEKEILSKNTDIVISSAIIPDNKNIRYIKLPQEEAGLLVHNDLLSKFGSIQELIKHERLIQKENEVESEIFNTFLKIFFNKNGHCNITRISDACDIPEFISSAAGYSLIAGNNKFIPDMKRKNCSFISLALPYRMTINRRVYFREQCNQPITDLVLKISEANN
ncbi:LysR family transcriptional regulator [Morganella morganii]|uniref:LysR family transcriptional regulator n=1 Tax=Morganella morganii TaxID=582 RepID=UPI000D7016B6|nr:LysR family transcriptional regulator [Morganella morganii]